MFLFLSRPPSSGGEEVLLVAASFRIYLKSINHPFPPVCSSTSACRLWLMQKEHLMPRTARPVKPLHPRPPFPPKWDSRCVPMATGLSDGPQNFFFLFRWPTNCCLSWLSQHTNTCLFFNSLSHNQSDGLIGSWTKKTFECISVTFCPDQLHKLLIALE